MNGRLLAVAILAVPLVASGCAVQGLPFEKVSLSSDKAVIYVYRPYNYGGSLLKPSVTCGEDTARVGPGGYHAFIVSPGHVVCSVQTETADVVELNAEPHAYYIKEEIGWGVLTGHPHLDPIDNDEAQSEIQSCCVQEQ
jgi:hypothetical protein